MTKPCSVCAHPKRTQIETEITNGTPYRDIEKWYDVGRSALSRHKNEGHLNPEVIKSLPPAVIAKDETLQQQLKDLHARTLSLLEGAEASGDGRMALAAIRECRSNLEVLAKIELVLMERANPADNGGVTITFDHEDMTPDRRGPVTLYIPHDGRRQLDVKDELAAKIEGMILNRKHEILGDRDVQVSGQSMMGEYALLEAVLELREMCRLAGITVESLKRDVVSEYASPELANEAATTPDCVAKQEHIATIQSQTYPQSAGPETTPSETVTTGLNREESLDDAANDERGLEAVRQAVETISGRMVQHDAPVAFVFDRVRQQGIDAEAARRALSVLVERGLVIESRPGNFRPAVNQELKC